MFFVQSSKLKFTTTMYKLTDFFHIRNFRKSHIYNNIFSFYHMIYRKCTNLFMGLTISNGPS